MPKLYQDSLGIIYRYLRGMKIPEGDTKIVYYKYNRREEAKVVPRHLVHPKVFATLLVDTPGC